MSTLPSIRSIDLSQLVASATELKQAGWRLVQIGATRLPDAVELTYSFDRDLELANLRVQLPLPAPRVPSISSIYWCAFLYENEIHDLFDVQVDGMAIDFHGHLYQTTIPFPFAAAPKPKTPAKAPPTPAAAVGSNPATVPPSATPAS